MFLYNPKVLKVKVSTFKKFDGKLVNLQKVTKQILLNFTTNKAFFQEVS